MFGSDFLFWCYIFMKSVLCEQKVVEIADKTAEVTAGEILEVVIADIPPPTTVIETVTATLVEVEEVAEAAVTITGVIMS